MNTYKLKRHNGHLFFPYNYYNTLVTAEFNFQFRFPRKEKYRILLKYSALIIVQMNMFCTKLTVELVLSITKQIICMFVCKRILKTCIPEYDV